MSTENKAPLKARFFLMAGMLTFGIAAIIVRFGDGAHPFVLAALRTLLATAVMVPLLLFQQNAEHISWKKKSQLLGAGLLLGVHFLLWTMSLSYTSVAASSVLVTSHPVILLLVERFFFKRSFSGNVWLGVAVAVSGSVVLSLGQPDASIPMPHAAFGNALAFLSALMFVVYALVSGGMRQTTGVLPFTTYVYMGSAIACSTAAAFVLDGPVPQNVWFAALALALGPQLIGHGSVAYAVKYFRPTFISTLILVEPILASVLAFWFFHEKPSAQALAGMALVITGIVFTWSGSILPKKNTQP